MHLRGVFRGSDVMMCQSRDVCVCVYVCVCVCCVWCSVMPSVLCGCLMLLVWVLLALWLAQVCPCSLCRIA
jgi:hypothetical protein